MAGTGLAVLVPDGLVGVDMAVGFHSVLDGIEAETAEAVRQAPGQILHQPGVVGAAARVEPAGPQFPAEEWPFGRGEGAEEGGARAAAQGKSAGTAVPLILT